MIDQILVVIKHLRNCLESLFIVTKTVSGNFRFWQVSRPILIKKF